MSGFSFIEALRQTAIIPPPNSSHPQTITSICRDVMKRHGLTRDQFYSRSRIRHVAWARQEAMYLAHKHGKSLPMIGRHFGYDHTTILHGVRAHEKRLWEKA